MRFVKPLDADLLHIVFKKFDHLITIEDGTIVGGFGSAIIEFASNNGYMHKNIIQLGIPDKFISHGTVEELHDDVGISKKRIKNFLQKTHFE